MNNQMPGDPSQLIGSVAGKITSLEEKMPKRKIPTKNTAAVALARLSAAKRYKTMTAEQRSEQGRMAVAARRDRQKPAGAGNKGGKP